MAAPRTDGANERISRPVLHAAVVAALGGLLFGFDSAVISGTTEALERTFRLTPFWLGFTVAAALIGTVVGSLAASRPADALGRRKTLLLLAVLYLVSAVGCLAAPDWWTLLAARFVGGLAIGGSSVVAPLYTAEIAPAHLRGRLVAVTQLNVVVGILLSYLSNYLVARFVVSDDAWRWMLGVAAVPSLAFLLLVFGIPESPRWLVRRGRIVEATAVLRRLRAGPVDGEVALIQGSLRGAVGSSEPLLQRRYARPIFLAWAVAMFNQISGINALIYYAPRIFASAGAKADSALFQAVLIGLTNLVGVLAAMAVIDRIGRRALLLIGSVGTALCLGAVTWAFAAGPERHGTLVLGALMGFIGFFSFSQGAVIWVFISEIFPAAVRAKGQALGSFTHWFMAAVVSWTFPVVARESATGAFAFFTSTVALQFLFAWKVMPETRGGTLEELACRLSSTHAGDRQSDAPAA